MHWNPLDLGKVKLYNFKRFNKKNMCSELIRSVLGVITLWIEAYRDNL